MHDTFHQVMNQIRALREDLALARKYELILKELAVIRSELGTSADLAKITEQVSGIESIVAQDTEGLNTAVEANKPE